MALRAGKEIYMKKSLIALLLAVCLLATACSKAPESAIESLSETDTVTVTDAVTPTDAEPVVSPVEIEPVDTYVMPTLFSIDDLKTNPETQNLFFTNMGTRTGPKELLVMIFNYKNGSIDKPDDVVEKEWSERIFGGGSERSVNDYFKEVSQGKFWFEPLCVGDNTSGIHVVNLDKNFSDKQGFKDYGFFDFSRDGAKAMDKLVKQGLDINRFKAEGISKKNYVKKLRGYYDMAYEQLPPQWYETDALMYVFPPLISESTELTPLTSKYKDYGIYCCCTHQSTIGRLSHELARSLGAVDTYNYEVAQNDLMCLGFEDYDSNPTASKTQQTDHINPYYKLIWGWCGAQLAAADVTFRLYPATSADYSTVLVPTDDPDQYFLIENRKAEGCDDYLGSDYVSPHPVGLTIWRIDKLSLQKMSYKYERLGIGMVNVLKDAGKKSELKYYASRDDINNSELTSCGITVELSKVTDDYVEINIDFQN